MHCVLIRLPCGRLCVHWRSVCWLVRHSNRSDGTLAAAAPQSATVCAAPSWPTVVVAGAAADGSDHRDQLVLMLYAGLEQIDRNAHSMETTTTTTTGKKPLKVQLWAESCHLVCSSECVHLSSSASVPLRAFARLGRSTSLASSQRDSRPLVVSRRSDSARVRHTRTPEQPLGDTFAV